MDKQKLLELKADLFDKMIDERCDWEGPRSVIAYLIESGCSKEELLALAFDKDDVEDLLQEANGQNAWDGCCPYCGSSNVDIVDEGDEDTKYVCRDCGEDFLVDNIDGAVTDRHNCPIERKEEK